MWEMLPSDLSSTKHQWPKHASGWSPVCTVNRQLLLIGTRTFLSIIHRSNFFLTNAGAPNLKSSSRGGGKKQNNQSRCIFHVCTHPFGWCGTLGVFSSCQTRPVLDFAGVICTADRKTHCIVGLYPFHLTRLFIRNALINGGAPSEELLETRAGRISNARQEPALFSPWMSFDSISLVISRWFLLHTANSWQRGTANTPAPSEVEIHTGTPGSSGVLWRKPSVPLFKRCISFLSRKSKQIQIMPGFKLM